MVRHLYGRPLETLLATWGVSLILIQAARVRYGDNIGVNSPTWLIGGFEVLPDFGIEYARCFILGALRLCVVFVYLLMNFTSIGLLIRATVQGRRLRRHSASRPGTSMASRSLWAPVWRASPDTH